jgi:hypothetical protein
MDRTLFSPPMIETFRVCRRAYQFAFGANQVDKISMSALCKRFILRALTEVHRGRLNSLPEAQKFLGQHWPTDKFAEGDEEHQSKAVQAFRFVYRVLTHYVSFPYRPRGSEVAAVSLKVRARVPHLKVYLEETMDLILWHPERATLEIVDFHLHPLKPFDPAWPTPSLLVRYFLADRLRTRWQFKKVLFTFCHLQTTGVTPVTIELDESLFRLHWPEVVKTLEQMKNPENYDPHRSAMCKRCSFLSECKAMDACGEGTASDTASSPAARTA